ncbi:hypothetical protein ACU4I5_03505 [Ensifer adhaerens]
MPHRCPLAVLAALGLVAVTGTANMAQAETKATPAATGSAHPAAATIGAFMPAGYREAGRRTAVVDGEAAELVRYERADGRNAALGGEHFSTVIADDGRLKGFARIDLDLVRHPLPTREEAQAIAMDFLREAAPDLLPGMRISWIDPHDEPLRVTRKGRTEVPDPHGHEGQDAQPGRRPLDVGHRRRGPQGHGLRARHSLDQLSRTPRNGKVASRCLARREGLQPGPVLIRLPD